MNCSPRSVKNHPGKNTSGPPDDDGSQNMGRRCVFTLLAQLSPIAGNSPSRAIRIGERRVGPLERPEKSDGDILSGGDLGELLCSGTQPSEPTPAHVPRSPAL